MSDMESVGARGSDLEGTSRIGRVAMAVGLERLAIQHAYGHWRRTLLFAWLAGAGGVALVAFVVLYAALDDLELGMTAILIGGGSVVLLAAALLMWHASRARGVMLEMLRRVREDEYAFEAMRIGRSIEDDALRLRVITLLALHLGGARNEHELHEDVIALGAESRAGRPGSSF